MANYGLECVEIAYRHLSFIEYIFNRLSIRVINLLDVLGYKLHLLTKHYVCGGLIISYASYRLPEQECIVEQLAVAQWYLLAIQYIQQDLVLSDVPYRLSMVGVCQVQLTIVQLFFVLMILASLYSYLACKVLKVF